VFILRWWRFFQGFVVVSLQGRGVERLLNLAVARGIGFWDLQKQKNEARLCLSLASFKALRPLVRQTHCRLHIERKVGLPFIKFRLRRRWGLVVGLVIFTLLFKIPFWLGVLIAAVIVVTYTYTGGLWAVAVTDMFQFTIMALSLGIALLICWTDLGGYNGIYSGLAAYLDADPWYFFSPSGGYLTAGVIASYALTSLAVLCEPAFLQRIFASRSPRDARHALLISTPIWTAYEFACCMLGLAAVAAVGLGVIGEPHANLALIAVVARYLPPGLIGLFLAGVLAAAMSTADSYFLVSSGNLVYDLYRPLFNPDLSSEKLMAYTRRAVIISAVISVALSFYFERIMGVWVFQASILINTVLIPLYASVFLKKLPKTRLSGSLATATGFFGTIFYYLLISTTGHFSEDWGTMVLQINFCGRSVELWQEYGIFLIPPFVLLAFLIGQLCGKEKAPRTA
jgi:Na+/proline symporter